MVFVLAGSSEEIYINASIGFSACPTSGSTPWARVYKKNDYGSGTHWHTLDQKICVWPANFSRTATNEEGLRFQYPMFEHEMAHMLNLDDSTSHSHAGLMDSGTAMDEIFQDRGRCDHGPLLGRSTVRILEAIMPKYVVVSSVFSVVAALVLAGLSAATAQEPPADSKTGSITGTVTYTDGRPVPLYPVDYRPVDKPEQRDKARTDKAGNYVISGLTPGEYFVGFVHPSRVALGDRGELESVQELAPGFAEADVPLAHRVRVEAGGAVEKVDFVLIDTGAERIASETVDTGPGAETLPGVGVGSAGKDAPLRQVAIGGLASLVLLLGAGLLVRRARVPKY